MLSGKSTNQILYLVPKTGISYKIVTRVEKEGRDNLQVRERILISLAAFHKEKLS